MQVFHTLRDMEQQLASAFRDRYRRKDVALTGILLARPEDKLVKDGLLPNLEYWHYRSDNYTDFFCAGYVPVDFVSTARPVGIEIAGLKWGFDLLAFVEVVEDIESQTKWHYVGDPCLLLANAYYDGTVAKFDYYRSVRINFRQALDDKAIATPTELAEAVFLFAKTVNDASSDPLWVVSDKFGHRVLKKGFKDAMLGMLPSWLSPSAKAAMHFVVHELEPDGT